MIAIAYIMYFIVWAQRSLSWIVFESDKPVGEKILAFLAWIPFTVLKLLLDLSTLGATVYLYRRVHWYHRNER
jgi:branched-subunit amino acid transport protein AzlD